MQFDPSVPPFQPVLHAPKPAPLPLATLPTTILELATTYKAATYLPYNVWYGDETHCIRIRTVPMIDRGGRGKKKRRDRSVASRTILYASSSSSAPSDHEDAVEKEMRLMGLPTSFGGGKGMGGGKVKTIDDVIDAAQDDDDDDDHDDWGRGCRVDLPIKMNQLADQMLTTTIDDDNIWIQAVDESSGHIYYYNQAKQVSQWTRPVNEPVRVWQGAAWNETGVLRPSLREQALGIRERPETSGLLPHMDSALPNQHMRFENDGDGGEEEEVSASAPPPPFSPPPNQEGSVLYKYWLQRRILFHRFHHNEGIRLDHEGWFSVTPEAIAVHQAKRIDPASTVLDAFCGCGGNAIQMARRVRKVVACDLNAERLELARHNARVYRVERKITFAHGDFFTLRPACPIQFVFLSPPWGGPDYADKETFDLDRDLAAACGGKTLHDMLTTSFALLDQTAMFHGVVMYLPRNTNLVQLQHICHGIAPNLPMHVECNVLNRRLKAVTVYLGRFWT